MSRVRNFSRNLAAGYLQLGVNVVYSLVSIPLILHWLPKAEFGMWAVLVQLMSYVSIIDLGMTSAVARLLVDHKDDRANGNYGSLVKTAFVVSLIQGFIILLAVALSAPLLATFMKIPSEFYGTFVTLLQIQGVFTAISFTLRPFGLMLYAHQRADLQSYSDTFSLVAQLGLLLLFLVKGYGIYSFIYANAVTLLIGPAFLFWKCHRLGYLPQTLTYSRPSWSKFKEIFSYGKDVFLFNLGAQLQMASQTIVVSRFLGLEQAALWSVGTKMFNFVIPVMCRPNAAALPGMYEMLVRGEIGNLKSRFRTLVSLTASLGAFLGISFASCNHLFVELWTNGRIIWPPINDVMLGLWILILSMQTTHCCFVTVTKKIGAMRYVLFLEGCAFIGMASLFAPTWGIFGIISSSIFCTLIFSYQYSLRRSADFFHCSFAEIALTWIAPSLNLALIFSGVAAASAFIISGIAIPWRLLFQVTIAVVIGGALFLRLGLPREILDRTNSWLPSKALWLLKQVTR